MKETDQKTAFILEKFDPSLKLSSHPNFDAEHFLTWISTLKKEISAFKDHWKPKIETLQSPLKKKIKESEISPFSEEGYPLKDEPLSLHCFDEQKGHLNHRSEAALTSPKDSFRGLPFYTFPFNELLAFELSHNLNFNTVLNTCLAVVTSPLFHDVLDTPYEKNSADKEKICAVKQTEETQSPFETIVSHKDNMADFLASIDQESFEQAFLLDYLTGEINGKAQKYGLKWVKDKLFFIKKSAGQTFSNDYLETDTFLIAFPQVLTPLSEVSREKLINFSEEPIIYQMRFLGKSEAAISCFIDRARRMKELAKQRSVTLKAFVPIGLRENHWKAESFLLSLRKEGIVL